LLDVCRFVPDNLNFIVGGIVLLLIAVERWWPGWRRRRRRVLFSAAFAFQIAVMLELTFVTTASLLAASKVVANSTNP
jgi:hypothetical protein